MALLDVDEARCQPIPGLGLLAVDLLPQGALTAANPLAHLVQCAPALGGVGFDVRAPFLEELGAEALERFAQLNDGEALLFAHRFDPFGVRRELRLERGDGFALALVELRQLDLGLALTPIEVGGPGQQTSLKSFLDSGYGLSQLDPGPLGLPLDGIAPLFGEPALLLAELVARVCPRSRQEPLELEAAFA